MTDDQDRDLSRRLDELEPPAHRPGFWTDVRAEVAGNSTRPASDAEADLVENGGPVRLDDRRRPRVPSRAWLAAAAVVLVALVGGAVALDRRGDDAQDLATEPAEPAGPEDPGDPEDPDDATGPTGPLRPDGDLIERGAGSVVAVDPAGEFLYVADDAPDGGFGCEGAPRLALFVEPIDGGARQVALPVDFADATGGIEVRFGPAGEIAVHSQCEGYGAEIVTGTVGADGTVAEPTELKLNDVDLEQTVDSIVDLEFRTAGILVASTHTFAGEQTEHRHLYEFPVGPSEQTDLGLTDVVHLDVTTDGRLVTSSTDGTIRFDGEVIGQVPDIVELAVSLDGTRVFVAQSDTGGLSAFDTRSGERVVAPDVAVLAMEPVGSDEVVAITGQAPWTVRSVTFGDEVTDQLLLDSAQPRGLAVTPDATRLFTQMSVSGELVVVEQRLTR